MAYDLEQLKNRLSKLGVDLPAGISQAEDASRLSLDTSRLSIERPPSPSLRAEARAEADAAAASAAAVLAQTDFENAIEHSSKPSPLGTSKAEVLDVLRRCNEIEQCLKTAEDVAISANNLASEAGGAAGLPERELLQQSAELRHSVLGGRGAGSPRPLPEAFPPPPPPLEAFPPPPGPLQFPGDIYPQPQYPPEPFYPIDGHFPVPLHMGPPPPPPPPPPPTTKPRLKKKKVKSGPMVTYQHNLVAAQEALSSAGHVQRVHCGSGCGSARLREAEMGWAREKALLRRDAQGERKRAMGLEREIGSMKTVVGNKEAEVKQLRMALKARDASLTDLEAKLKNLQDSQAVALEEQRSQLVAVTLERDDLLVLLNATLRKLEVADDVVRRTSATSAALDAKMKAMCLEANKAIGQAQVARAHAEELEKEHQELMWSQEVMKRVGEMQLNHYRNKRAALEDIMINQQQP